MLNDKTISRTHAIIRYEHGEYVIYDTNTAMGTYVNGKLLVGGIKLADGDIVFIGSTEFMFQLTKRVSREGFLLGDKGQIYRMNKENPEASSVSNESIHQSSHEQSKGQELVCINHGPFPAHLVKSPICNYQAENDKIEDEENRSANFE